MMGLVIAISAFLFFADYGIMALVVIDNKNIWALYVLLVAQVIIFFGLLIKDSKLDKSRKLYWSGEIQTIMQQTIDDNNELKSEINELETELKNKNYELELLKTWIKDHAEYNS